MVHKLIGNILEKTSYGYIQDLILMIIGHAIDVLLTIVVIVILTKIIIIISNKIITRAQKAQGISPQRIETILSVFNNLIKYVMGIVGVVFVLISMGLPWESIAAAAGILGVVLGLGASDLITDTINGFFVIFENIYDIGEYVKINTYEGYVIELGIKSTVLRSYENEKIIIPNSKVQEVINYSKNDYVLYYKFSSSYDVKIEQIEEVINKEILPHILSLKEVKGATYLGLEAFLDSSISYSLKIVMDPENRFIVKRAVNSVIKKVYDKNDLEIPYQNITINYKKD